MALNLLNWEINISNRDFFKVGHSDPIFLNGKIIAQRIKGTLGITGLWLLREAIDGVVWHLDVDWSHPG